MRLTEFTRLIICAFYNFRRLLFDEGLKRMKRWETLKLHHMAYLFQGTLITLVHLSFTSPPNFYQSCKLVWFIMNLASRSLFAHFTFASYKLIVCSMILQDNIKNFKGLYREQKYFIHVNRAVFSSLKWILILLGFHVGENKSHVYFLIVIVVNITGDNSNISYMNYAWA